MIQPDMPSQPDAPSHPDVRTAAGDDSGTALILVLALLLFVGLVVAATLTYAQNSIGISTRLAVEVDTVYDVDGGLKASANQLRGSSFVDSGVVHGSGALAGVVQPCPPITVAGPAAGRDVAVTCQPEAGSGAIAPAVLSRPAAALLATGTGAVSGEPGLVVAGAQSVGGPVHSNTSIVATAGSLTVNGAVTAAAGCSGSISAGSTDCGSAVVATPAVVLPTATILPRAVPDPNTCSKAGGVVTFEPGYYDDAAALTRLMSDKECVRSTFWFPGAPGGAAYYFDFHNGEGGGHPGGRHVWLVDDPAVRIVGGGTTAPGAAATVAIPGSCPSPLHRADNAGVVFVFGGDSQWQVDAGQVELCGPGDGAAGSAPVALVGAQTTISSGTGGSAGPDTEPAGPIANPPGILKMALGSASSAGVAPPQVVPLGASAQAADAVREWDDVAVSAQIDGNLVTTGNVGQQAILTISGFDPAAASPATVIPAGSVLTYANLYVRHREIRVGKGARSPVAYIQATVTPNRAGAPQVGPVTAAGRTTQGINRSRSRPGSPYSIDTIDLLATPALQEEVSAHGFTGASVTWRVATKDKDVLVASVDSIQIAIGWEPPAVVRAQTELVKGENCVGLPTTRYPGNGACAMLSTSSAKGATRFHVQGMVHAPLAALDLRHTGIIAPVVADGIVARHVTLGVTPQAAPAYAGLALNWARPLRVVLRAHTCPTGGCPAVVPGTAPVLAAPWVLSGTATVQLDDPGAVIRPYGRAVQVQTWSVDP